MSEQPKYKTETELEFLLIAGSLADLSKFDFSCYNVQCLRIDSEEIRDICVSMTESIEEDDNWSLLNEISEKFSENEKPFVLLPLDFKAAYDESALYECYRIILLLFPSDLSICGTIKFELFDYKYLQWIIYIEQNFYSSGRNNYYDRFVYYHDEHLAEINSFIKLYHARKVDIEYIDTTVNAYVSSFQDMSQDMSFLNLCISLESIVEGNSELSYRIKRNTAILCAENRYYAEIIFYNLNLIYKLRSQIVHAGKYKYEKVEEYLPYLQSLVSRLIIELILQNVKTLKELNRLLTCAGFGDRNSLFENSKYTPMTLNKISYVKTFKEKLKR